MMSSDAEGDNKLNHFDVIRYPVDGVRQYFMVMSNDIVAGDIPTEHLNTKYIQLSIKGDKGDAGYTPIKGIDYVDGASGLGLSPRGAWANNVEYYQYDLVSHNGFLWYCLDDNLALEPSVDPVWEKIPISLQMAIGSDIPVNLEEGGLWLDPQGDGHIIMKTKKPDGQFINIYPETQASYVFDATGESLQRKIYQHYFERDDVKVTMRDTAPVYTSTATLLSNPSIVVAKSTLTDTSDENGMMVQEFTAYDETGVYVMYKCKNVYTVDDETGVYTRVPEVII